MSVSLAGVGRDLTRSVRERPLIVAGAGIVGLLGIRMLQQRQAAADEPVVDPLAGLFPGVDTYGGAIPGSGSVPWFGYPSAGDGGGSGPPVITPGGGVAVPSPIPTPPPASIQPDVPGTPIPPPSTFTRITRDPGADTRNTRSGVNSITVGQLTGIDRNWLIAQRPARLAAMSDAEWINAVGYAYSSLRASAARRSGVGVVPAPTIQDAIRTAIVLAAGANP